MPSENLNLQNHSLSPPSGSENEALPLNINTSPADLVKVCDSILPLNAIGVLNFHHVTA